MNTNFIDILTPVRYLTPSDAHFFTVDNRPVADLNTNVTLLNQGIDGMSGSFQFVVLPDQSTTVNTILVTLQQTQAPGLLLSVKVANTNTGGVAIITDGQVAGTSYPVLQNGNQVTAGQLIAGNWYILSFDGANYNTLAGTAGSVSANSATASGHALTQGDVESNYHSVNVASLSCTSLSVSGSGSFSGAVTTSASSTGANAGVQYQQLENGAGYQAAVVDWTNVSVDTVLNVGQIASYDVLSQMNSIPLHIACGDDQVYEIVVVNYNGNTTNFDLQLNCNNTGYAGQFDSWGFESSPYNNGTYFSASSTAAYSVHLWNQSGGSGMYWDDIYGASNSVFLRQLRIYTGNTSGVTPCGLGVGGGGTYEAPNTALVGSGNDLICGVWNNNSTAYTSLGTLVLMNTNLDAEWQLLVRRVA